MKRGLSAMNSGYRVGYP